MIASVTREIREKEAIYMYEAYMNGALRFSRMSMCIEILMQVSKQENAHVFIPVGWYALRGTPWTYAT